MGADEDRHFLQIAQKTESSESHPKSRRRKGADNNLRSSLLLLISLSCLSHLAGAVHFDEATNQIHPMMASADNRHHTHKHGHHHRRHHNKLKIFFQIGNSEDDLPVCSPHSVCNKIDTYGTPWVEKQCRCPGGMPKCSTATHAKDGRTVHDRTRQYKTCEPVRSLRRCKFFREVTWTYILYPDNTTQQIMHCRCPRNSVAYLIKRHAYQVKMGEEQGTGTGFQYSFACSPQTKLRCQRKEPCSLFSVRKSSPTVDGGGSSGRDEVSTSSLCQCPHRKRCPKHHLEPGVIPGKTYSEDSVRTYSGYCV